MTREVRPGLEAQAAFLEFQAAELRHEAERLSEEASRLRVAAQRRDASTRHGRSEGRRSTRRGSRSRPVLTPRQREILSLIVRGHTNRQIAEQLVITSGTTANHVAQMLGRVGLENRVQLAAWAIENLRHVQDRAAGAASS